MTMEPAQIFATPSLASERSDVLDDASMSPSDTEHATSQSCDCSIKHLFGLPRIPISHPTSDDWHRFQPLIQHLYMHKRSKLRDIQHILGLRYGFKASLKMFKERLRRWNARVNYTNDDYKTIFAALKNHPSLAQLQINNRDVDWSRVIRRLTNSDKLVWEFGPRKQLLKLAERAKERYAQMSLGLPDLSDPVIPPRSRRTSEASLTNLHEYIKTELSSDGAPSHTGPHHGHFQSFICQCQYGKPFSTENHPAEINQNYHRGLQLIAAGFSDIGFQMLGHASETLTDVLRQEHPALLGCLLKVFIGYSDLGSSEAQSQIHQHIVDMAMTVLGNDHPITHICQYLKQSQDRDERFQYGRQCAKIFTEALGRDHPFSVYMNQKLFEVLIGDKQYDTALEHARSELEPIFTQLHGCPQTRWKSSSVCFCFYRRKARLFRYMDRCDEAMAQICALAELLLAHVQNNQSRLHGNALFEEVFRAASEIGELLRTIGHHEYSIEAHTLALDVCVAVRGLEDGKTKAMVLEHWKRLFVHGHIDDADKLYKKFPTILAGYSAIRPTIPIHRSPMSSPSSSFKAYRNPNFHGHGKRHSPKHSFHKTSTETAVDDGEHEQDVVERLTALSEVLRVLLQKEDTSRNPYGESLFPDFDY